MNQLEKSGSQIVKLLQKEGFQAFWVGGVVRDKILSRRSDNLDIATDAKPDQVEKILNKAKITNKPVGKQFGSILAIADEQKIEITTFRSEGYYSDNRHPDFVNFISDYAEDAKRRDLTINALYFDPIEDKLLDPVGGMKDIKAKIIRFVGNPKKRIDEDALRMLRAVRFATQLSWKMERNTFAAIKTRAKYIQDISGERIKAELDKILLSKNRAEGIRLLDETGLLKFIIPEFEPLKKFSHKSRHYHLEGSQLEHTLLVIQAAGEEDNLDLLYALLFHDIGKPLVGKKVQKNGEWVISTKGHNVTSSDIFQKFAKKNKFSRQSTKNSQWLIYNHMTQTTFGEMRISKQLELATNPNFELLIKHWYCDETGCIRATTNDPHAERYRASDKIARQLLKNLREAEPLIKKLASGDLIMKYSGLKPGKILGQKIDEIKSRIVLGQINSVKDLKKFLKTIDNSSK